MLAGDPGGQRISFFKTRGARLQGEWWTLCPSPKETTTLQQNREQHTDNGGIGYRDPQTSIPIDPINDQAETQQRFSLHRSLYGYTQLSNQHRSGVPRASWRKSQRNGDRELRWLTRCSWNRRRRRRDGADQSHLMRLCTTTLLW